MNELTVIVDLIAKLGAEGKEAFIWWLIMDKGLGVFGWLMTLLVLVWLILKVIATISQNEVREYDLRHLRDAMQVGCRGTITRGELHEMQAWVEAHKGSLK